MSNFLYLIGSMFAVVAGIKTGSGYLIGAGACFMLGAMLKFKEYPDVIYREAKTQPKDAARAAGDAPHP